MCIWAETSGVVMAIAGIAGVSIIAESNTSKWTSDWSHRAHASYDEMNFIPILADEWPRGRRRGLFAGSANTTVFQKDAA